METLRLPVAGQVFDAVADGPADGPVVLFLHGFPQTSWSWRHVWPAVAAAGFRTVAPDQRGYSPDARPAETSAYAMPHLVGDALGIVDALGATRVHVVGHDWGAAVAWQLAARHPSRVASLTALSVPHPLAFVAALRTDPDQRQRSGYMKVFAADGLAEGLLLEDDGAGFRALFDGAQQAVDTDHYLTALRRPGALTAALSWYRAQDLADVEDLPPVTTSTLYVWSDGDVALGRTAAETTGDHVAGPYRFEVLSGVTHWLPEQAPRQLVRLLLEHLAATR